MVIYDTKIQEEDLLDASNYALLKAYVPQLLVGVTLPYPDLISSKDHRARASMYTLSGVQMHV